MKMIIKAGILGVLVSCFVKVSAQEKHVIFIQSENKQQFAVQLNGQSYPSTASGFLILSQLLSGKYYLVTSFPKEIYPEQKFIVDIEKYDKEFTLKKNGEKDFVLVDMIENKIVGTEKEQETVAKTEVAENKPAATKIDTAAIVAVAVKEDSAVQQIQQPVIISQATQPVQQPSTVLPATGTVIKTFEKVAASGVDLIYIDKTNAKNDTIAIFIPTSTSKPLIKVAEPVKPTPVTVKPTADNVATTKPTAGNDGFLKTRSDMAAAANEEDMLRIAKLAFKTKTYTTQQIKNLSVLFLSEKEKFRFFEMAKSNISDNNEFPSLQSQLSQPEIIEKFKSLIKKD